MLTRSASNVFRTTRTIPQREYTRAAPKVFDGGDIDNDGQWQGADMGCLECRETRPMRATATAAWCVAALCCGECRAPFAEYRV